VLLYLYGLTSADAPDPGGVAGLHEGPVRLIRDAGLAGIVSEVPAGPYSADHLEARMADLEWMGRRGVEHERVLNWFVDRGAVVPLAPFSLHANEDRVRERLRELAGRVGPLLERLAGRREWGVRVRRTPAVAHHLGELSPRLRALIEQIDGASPGRRYLLERKLDAARADELRSAVDRLARDWFGRLAERAEQAERLPIAVQSDSSDAEVPVLHAAFLVADEALPGFERALADLVGHFSALGFAWEFTGPWPPYHFVEP
jgi:hypothetical protein